ncbi:flippase-like domain-containing protein [Candidatus Binatia bacterium]|nr:flippase-like domain-containing protein [Candidatus Binatia bacterium]
MRLRYSASLLIRLGVSVGLVALIGRRVDLTAIGRAVESLSAVSLLVALGVAFLQKALCVQRWIWIQRQLGRGFGFWRGLHVSYGALCLGQAFPSFVGGDAYRAYWLYQEGHSGGAALRGVFLDRASAVVVLVFMLVAGVPWILIRFDDAGALSAIFAVLAGGLVGTVALFGGDAMPARWRRWRLLAEMATLSATARAVLLAPGTGSRVNGMSLAAHVAGAGALWMVARDMGLPVHLRDCLVLVPLVMLVSAVPLSIAGWGIRESVMVSVLPALGVETEAALVLSLVLGFVALFHGIVGAIPLAFGPVQLRAVRRAGLRRTVAGGPVAKGLPEAGVLTAP